MHKEIFTREQVEILPLISRFRKEYYLAGGTAIALYLGHRRSIDFDLFSGDAIKRKRIRNIIEKHDFPLEEILYEAHDQLHIVVNGVKMTFFQFPHPMEAVNELEAVIRMPSLLDLAAMKAHALGGRAKWKDYADLFFLLRDHFDLRMISDRAKEIFGKFFNEKLFREQLSYFEDIDYRERIEFVKEEVSEKEIKEFLTEVATMPF